MNLFKTSELLTAYCFLFTCYALRYMVLCSPTQHRISHEGDLLFPEEEVRGVLRHHAPMDNIQHSSHYYGHRLLCPIGFTCINYQLCTSTNRNDDGDIITPSQNGALCNDASSELICCKNSSLSIEDDYANNEPQEELPEAEEQRQSCPTGSYCVDYRSCINGVLSSVSRHTSRLSDILKLSYEESKKLGISCSISGEICCKETASSVVEELEDLQQCRTGFECVHYRFCDAQGFISNSPFSDGPSFQQWLGLIGTQSCGNSGHREMLCCKKRSYIGPTYPTADDDYGGCTTGKICISYQFCRNGIISSIPSSTAISPTYKELLKFGEPCGRSGREVCCTKTSPVISNSRANIAPIKSAALISNNKDSKSPWSVTLEAILDSIVTAFANNLVGCPTDSTCINYRFCHNGIITQVPSSFGVTGPTLLELTAFGTPCGKLEVCCKRSPQSAVIGISNVPQKILPEITKPLCPDDLNCINYRWCANGVVTDVRAGFDLIGPSFEELKEYGRPCGKSEVCCKGTIPSNDATSGEVSRTTTTLSPTEASVIAPTTESAISITKRRKIRPIVMLWDPKPINRFRPSSNDRPNDTQMAVSTARRNSSNVAIHQSFYDGIPVSSNYIHQSRFSSRNQNKNSMMSDESQIAYEDYHNECPSSSYKCVPRHLCNLEGFIVFNKPFQIPKYRKQDRLPLKSCWNSKLNQVGFCCRDTPNYSQMHSHNNIGHRRHNFDRFP